MEVPFDNKSSKSYKTWQESEGQEFKEQIEYFTRFDQVLYEHAKISFEKQFHTMIQSLYLKGYLDSLDLNRKKETISMDAIFQAINKWAN